MHIFMTPIIEPMLGFLQPKKIVEIGALYGHNTMKLLAYCQRANAELYVIDPAPAFDIHTLKVVYGNHFHMLQNYSLQVLHNLEGLDFVLIDGDHNWYTVYHELKTIENLAKKRGAFPTVLLHDTEWPYARRDMYYFPESIPDAYRHPCEQKGVLPGHSELVEGGVNGASWHAVHENGERNGVLTAIEDFLKETDEDLSFYRVAPHHGLGILIPKNPHNDQMMQKIIADSGL